MSSGHSEMEMQKQTGSSSVMKFREWHLSGPFSLEFLLPLAVIHVLVATDKVDALRSCFKDPLQNPYTLSYSYQCTFRLRNIDHNRGISHWYIS